jgi:hypothetical protein
VKGDECDVMMRSSGRLTTTRAEAKGLWKSLHTIWMNELDLEVGDFISMLSKFFLNNFNNHFITEVFFAKILP